MVSSFILVPIYQLCMVPILRKYTGRRRGLTSLQRMGVGLFVSIFSQASAALVEKQRRDDPNSLKMSVFWLFPQFFLLGTSEVFTYVGQLKFFYDQATDGTSISSAFFLSEIGIGSWLSTALVKIVERATGGEEKGWSRNDLNQSRLDNSHWLLTAINGANFLVSVWIAWRFKGNAKEENSVRDESTMLEMGRGQGVRGGGDDNGELRSVMF